MDLSGLLDMNYFWWVFNKIVAVGIVFLVIWIAIQAAGWLFQAIIQAFKSMRGG